MPVVYLSLLLIKSLGFIRTAFMQILVRLELL